MDASDWSSYLNQSERSKFEMDASDWSSYLNLSERSKFQNDTAQKHMYHIFVDTSHPYIEAALRLLK